MTAGAPSASVDAPRPIVASLRDVHLRYGKRLALDGLSLDIPAACMVGLIGPDGVGKSSLLSLIAGARAIQTGSVDVLGGDMARTRHRRAICSRIAFMPQGLGKNLYPTLSVEENLDFFGRVFGHNTAERARRIAGLLNATGLAPFASRPVGKLSGGMKQKLGLCCALIHDPDLLILDEPSTGVDPLSRRQLWELVAHLRAGSPGMSVLVATAYLEEAARFDWLLAMDAGRPLATGSPQELLARTGAASLDEAFVALLPEEKRRDHRRVEIPPRTPDGVADVAIEAEGLSVRFGDFTAVDHVSFQIHRGEIFGFVGSNGCGKTTTMKVLTGLLPASDGRARLFGRAVDPRDLSTRRRVGYMSQGFSLYSELTVRQNLVLHARLFHLPAGEIGPRVERMLKRFALAEVADALPDVLPLGQRQRLSLAVALVHGPELLILDEPTSGVDPVARDGFWRALIELSRRDHVTIFLSTHFMNEAERCDRIALMHAGRVLVTDTPVALVAARGAQTLEDAFIAHLEEASEDGAAARATLPDASFAPRVAGARPGARGWRRYFDPRRLLSYTRRESLELRRDPIRLTLALVGSVVLMLVMGYGITLDVDDLSFAVFDRDQTATSRGYILDLAGSRYFTERAPIRDPAELDRRMRSGELALAIEIPPGFARDVARGRPTAIGAWIDGSMPSRGEIARSYLQGVHARWLASEVPAAARGEADARAIRIETRFRYNPDVESVVAMVPAMIPLLLLLIPAMLTALSVVRERELGSIVNFFLTPVTRLEFLLGKQLPYIVLAMVNFLILTALAVTVFGVPLEGSFFALATAALVYVTAGTAIGLLISTFLRSQIAALFGTAVLTILPASEFSGMIDPVSSLEGPGRLIGELYPMTHFLTISRGAFSKALGFAELAGSFVPLLVAVPVLLGLSAALLRKQET